MTQAIAVAVVHGVGDQDVTFAQTLEYNLRRRWQGIMDGEPVADVDGQLVIEPIYWAPAVNLRQKAFMNRLKQAGTMRFWPLRKLIISAVAGPLVYQPTYKDRRIYDDVHIMLAKSLKRLAERAGENAPLCIIGHSMGTVVASNYIWDLQEHTPPHNELLPPHLLEHIGDSPLERGETLAYFYTLGSPLALWGMQRTHGEYGEAFTFPPPELVQHWPQLRPEWINFYDADDIIGFPLKGLNQEYDEAVTEDREVNVGSWRSNWNPFSHNGYWASKDVVFPIADALKQAWTALNTEDSPRLNDTGGSNTEAHSS